MAREAENLLKGQHTKICLQPLTLGIVRGRAKWTRVLWGESGFGGSGNRAEWSAAKILVLSHSHTEEDIFLKQRTPLHVTSAWREESAPPTGIPLLSPYGV